MTGRLARENTLRNPKRTSVDRGRADDRRRPGRPHHHRRRRPSRCRSTRPSTTRSPATSSSTRARSASAGSAPTLADDLNELPEVETATGIRFGIARVGGFGEAMLGVDPATAFDILDVGRRRRLARRPRRERHRPLRGQGRSDFGLRSATPLPIEFAETGEQELEVAMIYGDDDILQGTKYLLGRAAFEANFPDQFDLQVFVDPGPTTSRPTAGPGGDRGRGRRVTRTPRSRTSPSSSRPSTTRSTSSWTVIYALLMLAVVIALLRHRQHAGPVDHRAHPRARPAAGRRHDPAPAADHGPLGGRADLRLRHACSASPSGSSSGGRSSRPSRTRA